MEKKKLPLHLSFYSLRLFSAASEPFPSTSVCLTYYFSWCWSNFPSQDGCEAARWAAVICSVCSTEPSSSLLRCWMQKECGGRVKWLYSPLQKCQCRETLSACVSTCCEYSSYLQVCSWSKSFRLLIFHIAWRDTTSAVCKSSFILRNSVFVDMS